VFQATPQRTPPARQDRPQTRSWPSARPAPSDRRRRLVEEGADQALGHRQRDEQQQQRRCTAPPRRPRRGRPEEAQPRHAGAQQHQQRQQHQRTAQPMPNCPRQVTEQAAERLERPAGGADGEAAGQQPARPSTRRHQPSPAPVGAAGQGRPAAAPAAPTTARAGHVQRLHQAAGGLGPAEHAGSDATATGPAGVPGQQHEGRQARQPGQHGTPRLAAPESAAPVSTPSGGHRRRQRGSELTSFSHLRDQARARRWRRTWRSRS
jgi:hypothetical protein